MDGPSAASGCRLAHEALLRELERIDFSDEMATQPSLLPGWTVAHVLTHLARNADSHRRMVAAASRGHVVDQYPGGASQREQEIEAGSNRSADALLEDLRRSDRALADSLAAVAPQTWERALQRRLGRPWPVVDLPFLRWREVALHATDLGLDLDRSALWSAVYVDHELRRQLGGVAARLPGTVVRLAATDAGWSTVVTGTGDRHPEPFFRVEGTAVELLAWLVGRSPGEPTWPPLAVWQGMP